MGQGRHRLHHSISIHALRKESDLVLMDLEWKETISIHALRKESDMAATPRPLPLMYFNPRSP